MISHEWTEEELATLTPEELRLLNSPAFDSGIWSPHPDNIPQHMAYECEADILGYGGAAGGGKTDLGLGKALTKHEKIAIFRRESPQLLGIINRLTDILGTRDGYNGKDNLWRDAGPRNVYIEFGSAPHAGDETKHQGRDKDLLIIEEAANFLASQVRFLMGWVRTTKPGLKCQTLLTFNPPTNVDGQWIIEFFAPWLDPKHPRPALPGELRWAASLPATEAYPNGRDIWPEDGRPFVLDASGEPLFEFNEKEYAREDIINPKTRTFISARVSDNPYLMGTGYMSTLQALPEPLRSQMLKGDFRAGMQDDPWQLCPTAWVEAAMDRWVDKYPKEPMDSLGCDVARGGKDNTINMARHGMWFDYPKVYPGFETPDGNKVAGLCMADARDGAVVHIDIIGVGASPYDVMNGIRGYPIVGVDVRVKADRTDKSGKLRFFNMRSQLGWLFREMLDPANNTGIQLPPDPRLKSDLCCIKWSVSGMTIKVEGRDDIYDRLKRSPDWASAVFLAAIDTPKAVFRMANTGASNYKAMTYDPYQGVGMLTSKKKEYNPYDNM